MFYYSTSLNTRSRYISDPTQAGETTEHNIENKYFLDLQRSRYIQIDDGVK